MVPEMYGQIAHAASRWSKPKRTSQALAGADFTRGLANPVRWRWKKNHIRLPLMVSFVVKTVSVMGDHVAEGGLPKQDQFRQSFLLHRAIPSLQMRVQVWAPRGQHQRFDPCGPEDVIKGGRELRISIVQQVTATVQHPLPGHRHVSSHLLHPTDIRPRCETGDTNLSGRDPHEHQDVVGHQSACRPDFGREEIYRCQGLQMRSYGGQIN